MPYSKDFSASVWKDIHSLISLDSGLDSVLVWAGVGWLCHGLGLVSAWAVVRLLAFGYSDFGCGFVRLLGCVGSCRRVWLGVLVAGSAAGSRAEGLGWWVRAVVV